MLKYSATKLKKHSGVLHNCLIGAEHVFFFVYQPDSENGLIPVLSWIQDAVNGISPVDNQRIASAVERILARHPLEETGLADACATIIERGHAVRSAGRVPPIIVDIVHQIGFRLDGSESIGVPYVFEAWAPAACERALKSIRGSKRPHCLTFGLIAEMAYLALVSGIEVKTVVKFLEGCASSKNIENAIKKASVSLFGPERAVYRTIIPFVDYSPRTARERSVVGYPKGMLVVVVVGSESFEAGSLNLASKHLLLATLDIFTSAGEGDAEFDADEPKAQNFGGLPVLQEQLVGRVLLRLAPKFDRASDVRDAFEKPNLLMSLIEDGETPRIDRVRAELLRMGVEPGGLDERQFNAAIEAMKLQGSWLSRRRSLQRALCQEPADRGALEINGSLFNQSHRRTRAE